VKNKKITMSLLISHLLADAQYAQKSHWAADNWRVHEILGAFYTQFNAKTDAIVETLIGSLSAARKSALFTHESIDNGHDTTVQNLIQGLETQSLFYRAQIQVPENEVIVPLLEDLRGIIHRTIYLLRQTA
jgi:hypothetical protein